MNLLIRLCVFEKLHKQIQTFFFVIVAKFLFSTCENK